MVELYLRCPNRCMYLATDEDGQYYWDAEILYSGCMGVYDMKDKEKIAQLQAVAAEKFSEHFVLEWVEKSSDRCMEIEDQEAMANALQAFDDECTKIYHEKDSCLSE